MKFVAPPHRGGRSPFRFLSPELFGCVTKVYSGIGADIYGIITPVARVNCVDAASCP